LAAQLGAKTILLIGFDMTDSAGVHWYGRNNWEQANNPTQDCFGAGSPRSDRHPTC
jgi:uncharacterized Rossmann fold enzyme